MDHTFVERTDRPPGDFSELIIWLSTTSENKYPEQRTHDHQPIYHHKLVDDLVGHHQPEGRDIRTEVWERRVTVPDSARLAHPE